MSNFTDRFNKAFKESGLSQHELAKAVQVSQPAIRKLIQGQSLSFRKIGRLAKVLRVNVEWLSSGDGAMKDDNYNISDLFTPLAMKRIPLISFVQAGTWTEACELKDSTGYDYVTTSIDVSTQSFALTINGASMEPIFNEGDLIIIDPTIPPIPGDYVVAMNSDTEATFKKYREVEIDEYGRTQFDLVPLNSFFTTWSSKKMDIKIIGTMIEHRIFRRK